jgi:NAD(P)-dependent dehydrogenase (short-subunit alcohol dehydrogenase family)
LSYYLLITNVMTNRSETNAATPAAIHDKKVALITGANRGIGLQVAKELGGHGFSVVIGARKLESAKEAVAEVGANAYPVAIDVTNNDSITAAAAHITAEFGRLDLLVNNAGIAHAGAPGRTLEEILASGKAVSASLDEVREVWETNVFGVLAVSQAFLPLLRQAPSARIVNVSSGMASLTLNSDPSFPFRGGFGVVYGASKTALNAITLSLAMDLESTNIKVEAASPGFTATAMNNFQGTDSLEEGSRNIVRAALGENGPESIFSGSEGAYPW